MYLWNLELKSDYDVLFSMCCLYSTDHCKNSSIRRLGLSGHVGRMDNPRISKQILYGELSEGTRNVGRPKLRFNDQRKTPMMEFSVKVANWDMVDQDRVGWRAAVIVGVKEL